MTARQYIAGGMIRVETILYGVIHVEGDMI